MEAVLWIRNYFRIWIQLFTHIIKAFLEKKNLLSINQSIKLPIAILHYSPTLQNPQTYNYKKKFNLSAL